MVEWEGPSFRKKCLWCRLGVDGAVVYASVWSVGICFKASESDYGKVVRKESGIGEGIECYGVDKAYEYAESTGGGSCNGGSYILWIIAVIKASSDESVF